MITIKQNDDGIGIRAKLTNENGNVDLTDASVKFYMRNYEIQPAIEDAENGVVVVVLNDVHTSKTGFFATEFKVTFLDGRTETFPNDGYLKVNILKDLGVI